MKDFRKLLHGEIFLNRYYQSFYYNTEPNTTALVVAATMLQLLLLLAYNYGLLYYDRKCDVSVCLSVTVCYDSSILRSYKDINS